MRKFTTFLLSMLLATIAMAQSGPFTDGTVYHFQNIGNTGVALAASALTDVAAVTSNKELTAQQWYCEKVGDYYTFRNLSNGKYLKGNGTSAAWTLTDDNSNAANKFNVVSSETKTNDDATTTTYEGYTIYSSTHEKGTSGGGGSMHKDGSNNIVGWGSYNNGSRWTISTVEYTEEELAANWAKVTELIPNATTVTTYETALKAIFIDAACTTLNSEYTSANMTDDDLEANANYSVLHQTLKNMVKKVRGGNWSEETVALDARPNGNNSSHGQWDVYTTWEHDYAKKFRVQMYEPYSIEGEITSYLRFNAHCNMDNPTGIYANRDQAIYIMVEGTIEDGAELWLAHQSGHGATSYYNNIAYTELHEGLNAVPYFTDGCQLWINYVVHTYNGEGTDIETKFPHKLSEYKPLKIHIEGGYINGYFNAMGDFRAEDSDTEDLWGEVDNDEDWNYYKSRAALATDFALLGHRQTLLFDFGTWNSSKGFFGVANDGGGIDKALAYWLENIQVPETPNCHSGSGNTFGDYSDTYYPGMNLDAETGKINIMLEAWDRVMYSEHATMGLLGKTEIDWMNKLYPGWTAENTTFDIYNYGSNDTGDTYKAFCNNIDYSDYYNHHGAAVGAPSGYMSGGWRVCNYHYNTMGSIIGQIAVAAGPTWGPAHEIGHQHQGVFNLNGQTEVTNNFFSNVAVWYMGMGTSRYNGNEGSLSSVLNAYNTDNNDLYTNNIWAITHLYYRLWLYYHLAGNNTQFWPRLFELLRQTPMANGGQISGETSLLRFYKHACDAAGEDLTEFFRAHGYFEIMDNRLVGDYSNATYNVTQSQIDAAISEIKAKNYPVNYAVLLINDGTAETTLKHDGATRRALWDGSATAEFGSVNDFIDGDIAALTGYTATVDADGSVTMSGGEGGVGFLIFNKDGELVSFSNKSTFEISDETAYLLATGKASIVAVDAENNTEEAEVDLSAILREMLGALIANVEEMPIDDGSYTHAGFYTKSSAEDLLAVLESAKTVYESTSGYGAAYELLYTEKEKFVNSANLSYVPFNPSLTYIIKSYAYGNTMYLSNGAAVGTGIDETAPTSQWQFKTTGTDGVYKIYNTAGYYLTTPAKSTKVGSSSTESDGATFSLLQDSPVGAWAISLSPAAEYTTLHDNSFGKVVGWESGVNASKWYLTATTDNSNNTAAKTDALQALIAKTDALVNLVSEISYTSTPVALQTTNETGDYYVRTNATNTGGSNEGPIANLVDGKTGNFFHTQYANNAMSDDGLDHYIEVNMGSGVLAFNFSYTTRNGVYDDFPQVIKVYGSNTEDKTGDESNYVLLATISSGLPASSSQSTYTYPSVIDNGITYQYLRFMVPTTNTNRKTGDVQHNYWHMAEFDILIATAVATQYEDFTSIDAATIIDAYNAVNAAKSWVNYASVTDDQITSATSTLQAAYDKLKEAYDAVIKVKKDELEKLADDTDDVINSVAKMDVAIVTELTLTTENLYCNAPYIALGNSDYSAAYVDKLTDGSKTSYLHTDYSGAVAAPHYLRVDLGSSSTTTKFRFNYSTRDNGNNCPTTIVVEGCNEADGTYTTITTLTTADGLPNPGQNTNGGVAEDFESSVISMSEAYRYVRFKVTGVEGGNATFFVISEFGFSTVEDVITIEPAYKGIVSEDLWLSTYHASGDSHLMADYNSYATLAQIEAQITKLTEAKAALEAAMNQVDKSALETSLSSANSLYGEMADGEGNVTSNYTPSSLTTEQLAALKTLIDAAQTVYDNAGATQADVNDAKNALDEKYNELLAVKEANVNLSGTYDKSTLNALIASTKTLLGTINGNIENNSNYYASSSLALDELNTALRNAQDAVSRYYLTETQYTAAYEALNDCYAAANNVVTADVANRATLTELIAQVNTLMGNIATGCAAKNVAVPLQSTTADGDFYISVASTSSGSIANLYDKNADGTAITAGDSYYGSNWGSVAAYSQYVQVDLGEGIKIDKLLFDYTTRDSGHSTERPTSIKVLGSNNGTDYTEITVITEGMPVGQRAQWSLTETLELGAPYRYVRFAVDSEAHSFHMSDFNLYALIGHTLALKEYYTTATGLGFNELCIALQSAEYAEDHYLTNEQLSAVVEMLNSYYTATSNVVNADYTTRDDLATLIDDTNTLIDKVATVTVLDTPELSETNVYCNADNSTNTNAGDGDKLGVGALFDNNPGTHLHTTYGGNAQDDDEDHYIRVDMGENSEITAFKFSYTGRQANSNNAPTDMLVQACNTTDGEWVTLKTLTRLPTGTAPVFYESELIEMTEPYRYVRFMVTNTKNQSTTTYDGVEHKFFVMSEFGIETYPSIVVKDAYLNVVTNALVRTAYDEKNSANVLATGYYMTESEYNTTLDELQAAYDALNAATVADKTALNDLIDSTTLLKNSLYEIAVASYTATDVALQCTNEDYAGYLYCNAPETNSGSGNDDAGVAAAIDLTESGDPNLDTYLHTEYGDDQSADGLDHYLRVDLGADGATEYVEFGYVGRKNKWEQSPKTVVVAATNDLTGEWITIKTLTLAQPSNTTETKTGALGNGVAYRYWRFMVTDTYSGGTSNGHKFFALSDFNVYKCTDVVLDSQLKSEYNPAIYAYTTTELVAEVEAAIAVANGVKADESVTQAKVDAAVEALQVEYNKLAEAIKNYWCPVVLTTDATNPVLYTINAPGRGEGNAWQYSLTNNNITIVNKDVTNLYHLWYFVAGTEEHTVKIVPVMTPSYELSATDFTNGINKVSAVAESSVDWVFAYVNNYYNFKPYGKSTYLSNFNGGSNPLGFYGSADGGSYVSFTKVELENYGLARLAKLSDGKTVVNAETTVGSYADGKEYNEALAAAQDMLTAATSTPAEYVDAFTRLFNAYNGLAINMPDPEKLYVLRCNHESRYIYVNADNKMQWAASSYDKALSNAVWSFEEVDAGAGTFKMKSLHTQSYLSGLSGSQWAFGNEENGKVVTLVKSPSVDGAIIFKIEGNGDNGLHAHGSNNTVINHTNTAAANHYFFEEVKSVETIKYATTMSKVGYSTLMLGFDATIPEGITAYTADAKNGVQGKYLQLLEVEGGVLPANTAVILKSNETLTENKPLEFYYAGNDADAINGNMFDGSLYNTVIDGVSTKIYQLQSKSGAVKLYWMYAEYSEDGTIADGNKNTDDGGYVKLPANRTYLSLSKSQGASSYTFRFDWNGTTDIDAVTTGEGVLSGTIFDLQGRKLESVTAPGFYIVNGKKVYVREIE